MVRLISWHLKWSQIPSLHFNATLYLWQLYVWPLLETLFSEVLTRDEWLRLFDSVFSNHPSFLLMTCVAYITCCREPLLLCSRKQDFEVTAVSFHLLSPTDGELHFAPSFIYCFTISLLWFPSSIFSITVTTWMSEP